MASAVQPLFSPSFSTGSFSVGMKFFVLFFLAVFMSLPALFVSNLAATRAAQHGASTTYDDAGHAVAPHTLMGIKLADSYRSIQRSLKYVTLFLGLVFLTYFVFEITAGKRVHPGQYALVGVAQIIFYLLLLSLAEMIGFDLAFLVAGGATVALFSVNTEWVFASRRLAMRAAAVFSLLYGFIYVLLRLENYALLIGSLASFAAVAATMYVTRSVNWYSSASQQVAAGGASGSAGATASVRESWLD